MKKFFATCCLCCLAALVFSQNTVRVQAHGYPGMKKGMYSIVVAPLGTALPVTEAYHAVYEKPHHQAQGTFTLPIALGAYSITVHHPEASSHTTYFYTEKTGQTIQLDVHLTPYQLKPEHLENIDHVYFSPIPTENSGNQIGMNFDKVKNCWFLDAEKIPATVTAFYIYLEKKNQRFQINSPTIAPLDTLSLIHPPSYYDYPMRWEAGRKNRLEVDLSKLPTTEAEPTYTLTGAEDLKYIFEDRISANWKLSSSLDQAIATHAVLDTTFLKGVHASYDSITIAHEELLQRTPVKLRPLITSKHFLFECFFQNSLNRYFSSLSPEGWEHNELVQKSVQRLLNQFKNADVESPYFGFENFPLVINYILPQAIKSLGLEGDEIPYGYIDEQVWRLKKTCKNPELKAAFALDDAENVLSRSTSKLEGVNQLKKVVETYGQTHAFNRNRAKIDKLLKSKDMIPGAAAPKFTLPSTLGKSIDLESLKGKFVFLDFWGTWCGPCRAEIPNIVELRKAISEDKLAIIGIACHDREGDVKQMMQAMGINYTNVMADEKIQKDFGVNSYPTTFLLNPKGEIVAKNLRGELIEDVKAFMNK